MLCLMLALLLVAWPSPARAETWGQYLIVIDDSGSMNGSDPDRLVMLASLALVASLGDADQVMVAANERDFSFIGEAHALKAETVLPAPVGVFPRIIDPTRKLFARCNRSGGIVRKTKVNQIDMFCRRFRNKSVLSGARQIKKTFVAAVPLRRAAVARHHIGIDIDRIDRVRDCDFVLVAKNIENIPAIAFRPVRDKNLIIGDLNIAVVIIMLHDCRS